jgi:hypothetical protein
MISNQTLPDNTNNTTAGMAQNKTPFDYAFAVISILIIVLALLLNTTTFLIFRLTKEMRATPSLIYLSIVVVTDTLSLFTWNLNVYLGAFHDTRVEKFSLATCRIFMFLQYFSLEVSALLLSMLVVDRFFATLSKLNPAKFHWLPFNTVKYTLGWSVLIVLAIFGLNIHILILAGEVKKGGELQCYSSWNGSPVYNGVWDKVHMTFFSFIPFVVILVFNSLLVRLLVKHHRVNKFMKRDDDFLFSKSEKHLTVTIIVLTSIFLLMTMPAGIMFGLFENVLFGSADGLKTLVIIDTIEFFNRCLTFIVFVSTNREFRQYFAYEILRLKRS